MPFIHYSPTGHRCNLPSTRDDGSPLVYGDKWRCDGWVEVAPREQLPCNKIYRWTSDQRDGDYWEHLYKES